MSAEYTFYYNGSSVTDPVSMLTTATIDITVKNTGDEDGTGLGFYLKDASSLGPFDYPSSDSGATNLADIIAQGNDGYGLVLQQGVTSTRFEGGVGDTLGTKIPLTIGTGSDLATLAVGASVQITLSLSFAPSTTSKNFYVDLAIA